MVKNISLGLMVLLSCLMGVTGNSQNLSPEKAVGLNLGADMVSRYIWRGTDFGNSPSIQPFLSLTVGNLEIGSWGAVATNNSFKEIDLYATYTIKNLSLTVTDYFVPEIGGLAASPDNRFFFYGDKNTAHALEASVKYQGTENFPLWVTGGVFVYGNDKRWGYDAEKDSLANTYYSSYLEAGYSFAVNETSAELFVGATPRAGAYGDGLGVVNVGITASRALKITDDFELPLKGSLIFNPQANKVFFVFGITL